MTNDQIPMTNDSTCQRFGHWCLVIGHLPSHVPKRRRQQLLLLQRVAALAAGRGTGGTGPMNAGEWEAIEHPLAKMYTQESPRPLILRLLLHPVHRRAVGIVCQCL